MKYTLPTLTLAISAALAAARRLIPLPFPQPVVDSPAPNVAQPLRSAS